MTKNIIFDLGNVLLYDVPTSLLNSVQISSDNRKIVEEKFFGNFKYLDLGLISLEEHLNNCGIDSIITDELRHVLLNYYEYRSFNDEVINLMNLLNDNGYDVYILSDNNKETFNYLNKLPIFNCVKGWVMSCDYHLLKSGKELYLKLLEKYKLNSNECFFIDDKKENVSTSMELGMIGHVFNYKEEGIDELIKDLRKNNILI